MLLTVSEEDGRCSVDGLCDDGCPLSFHTTPPGVRFLPIGDPFFLAEQHQKIPISPRKPIQLTAIRPFYRNNRNGRRRKMQLRQIETGL